MQRAIQLPQNVKKGLTICLFLLFVFLFQQNISAAFQHYFYFNNPSIAAVQLEQEYKASYDRAEKARQTADGLIYHIEHEGPPTGTTFQEYDEKVQASFAERNAALSAMITQDKQAENTILSPQYKQFYTQRLLADTSNYTAFAQYSKGILDTIESVLVYIRYNEAYTNTITAFGHMDGVHGPTIAQLQAFQTAQQAFATEYSRVIALSETTNIYPPSLLTYFDDEHTIVGQIDGVVQALENKDTNAYAQLSYAMYAQVKQVPDIKNILLQWHTNQIEPLLQQPSGISPAIQLQYQHAYLVARDNKMTQVLVVWGSHVPGDSL